MARTYIEMLNRAGIDYVAEYVLNSTTAPRLDSILVTATPGSRLGLKPHRRSAP